MVNVARIGVLLAGALLVPAPAAASHCRPTEPICSDFWDAAAVFVGRVEALGPERKATPGEFIVVTTDPYERLARFEVLEAFRGPENVRPGSMVDVGFGSSLSPGATYFIYAHEDDRGRLIIGFCGRTKAVAEAAEDLRFARGLATDRSTEARVFGDVTWKEQTTTAPPRDPEDRLPRVSWIAAAAWLANGASRATPRGTSKGGSRPGATPYGWRRQRATLPPEHRNWRFPMPVPAGGSVCPPTGATPCRDASSTPRGGRWRASGCTWSRTSSASTVPTTSTPMLPAASCSRIPGPETTISTSGPTSCRSRSIARSGWSGASTRSSPP